MSPAPKNIVRSAARSALPEANYGSKANAAWRRGNIGHVLFAASRRFLAEKLDWVRTHGFTDLSDTMLSLLLALEPDGTRQGEIAERTNNTRSSVAELLDRAEQHGIVARRPDPFDGRGKIVDLTPRGHAALTVVHEAVARGEQSFKTFVGDGFTARFKRELGAYAAEMALGRAAHAGWHSANVGRVLALSARRFVCDVLAIVHAGGYSEINETLLSLVRNLDVQGTRLTVLAERAHVTKQSMRELVDRAEALHLVIRESDPADRRAKFIRFTSRGLGMLEDMRSGVLEAESRLGERLGDQFLLQVHEMLRAYVAHGPFAYEVGPIVAT